MRFGEAMAAAQSLKPALEARGLSVFLCAAQAGGNLIDEIVQCIDRCRLVVILGTATYGRDTGVGFCTADELKFIISEKKEIFLVKMCERFEESLARFRLGDHVAFHPWLPRTEAEQRVLPVGLVDAICTKLQSL